MSDKIVGTVQEFLLRSLQNYAQTGFMHICSIMWAIWEQRNNYVFSGQDSTPHQILTRASSFCFNSFSDQASANTDQAQVNTELAAPNLYQPTTAMDFSIYTDGAWNLDRGGWGILIFQGTHLVLFECGSSHSATPMHAEAIAIHQVVQALHDVVPLNQHPTAQISLLSDCSNLVEVINNSNGERHSRMDWRAERTIFQILHEIKQFSNLKVSHLPRRFNGEAHNLATNGLILQEHIRGFQFPTFKPP